MSTGTKSLSADGQRLSSLCAPAFSRDGAVLGHDLWGRLGRNRTPSRVVAFVAASLSWAAVNYAPLVTIDVMLAVTIRYLGSARKTFKGPIRTIESEDDRLTVADPGPGVA